MYWIIVKKVLHQSISTIELFKKNTLKIHNFLILCFIKINKEIIGKCSTVKIHYHIQYKTENTILPKHDPEAQSSWLFFFFFGFKLLSGCFGFCLSSDRLKGWIRNAGVGNSFLDYSSTTTTRPQRIRILCLLML